MAFYLVTGGAGFIGSHMVEALRKRGDRVRVADSLVTGKRSNLAHVDEVEFLEGDLADEACRAQAVDGVEYVLHQAAIPSVPRSVDDPMTSNRANIDATLSLLVAARDAGVKRVVYAGSSSAYGNAAALPKREDMPTGAAVAVRPAEAGGRAVHADVHRAVRPVDRDHPLLQRLRPAAGSRVGVLRRHLALHPVPRRGAGAHHPRRWRADARFHLS